MAELDSSTLDEITELICGDDGPLYRKGHELQDFLRRSGITGIPNYDGSYRRSWTRQALDGSEGETTNAERAILRLADPREYAAEQDAYQETLRRLAEILSLEGLQILHDRRGRPRLTELDDTGPDGARDVLGGTELKVSVAQVVADQALAAVAEQRLNEARVCHAAGAYMASIIMLGSMLEGVLVAVVAERLSGNPPKPLDRMGLEELINLAHREGWIQVDVRMGSELIRRYRNLVHPRAQLRMGDPPDADTLDICWPIVNATLNDLASTASRTA
jgi:hypothetical protein